MTDETVIDDAPEPIETETTDVVAEVEDELKGGEPSDSSPEPEEKPKANPAQKRIDELTRNRREAERERDYWRQQATTKPPERPVVEEPLKTLADFEYDETAYQEHLFSKARSGAVEEAKRVLREEQNQQASNRKATEFKAKEKAFEKSVEDYRDVITNPDLSISQAMVDVAREMDNGPEVLYHLGKHPDIAEQIAQLPPLLAARELGRIEAKLQSQEKTGSKVSKAPAPTPKISALEPSISKNPDEMTQKEWNAHRRKIIAKRGR